MVIRMQILSTSWSGEVSLIFLQNGSDISTEMSRDPGGECLGKPEDEAWETLQALVCLCRGRFRSVSWTNSSFPLLDLEV